MRHTLVRLSRLIHDEFWMFLAASIALAFVFPDFGRHVLKPLALPSILAQMYVVMLNIETQRLIDAFRSWRPMLKGLGLMFVVTPALSVLGRYFYAPEVALGLAVLCSMPSGMSSPFFALQFGGDAALAVALTTVGHLLVPFLAPLLVKLIAGQLLAVDPLLIFERLVELVIVPFVLAVATRKMLGRARTVKLHSAIGWTSAFFIFVVTWGIVADVTVASIPLLPLAVGMALLNVVLYLAGYFFGAPDAPTLSMTSGYRNVTLAMVLSASVFQDPLVTLPAVMFTLTQNAIAVPLLFWKRSRRANA